MTQLEKGLSEIVDIPVNATNISMSTFGGTESVPTIRFEIECVPNPDGYIPDEDIPFCDGDCDRCEYADDEDEWYTENLMWGIPDVRRVIFNPPATIVFWDDGTKTVVKAMDGEKFERYAGFAMACMKKMFGSTSRAKAIMEECDQENWKKIEQEAKERFAANNPKKAEMKTTKTIGVDQLVDAFVGALKAVVNKQEENHETLAE